MLKKPTNSQYNLYVKFMLYLNEHNGKLMGNSASFYNFLDSNKVDYDTLITSIMLIAPAERAYMADPYVYFLPESSSKTPWGQFYLTRDGYNLVYQQPRGVFPAFVDEPKVKTIDERVQEQKLKQEQRQKEQNDKVLGGGDWTRERVVKLLTTEAHIVGRMLGTGYDLLEPLHGQWINEWLINPSGRKVTIHQAHRDSWKSTSLRLCVAIFLILNPLDTIIIIRKSEDAVKELVNGVSKILDSPVFHAFVSILYPDINKKGGFKKTTDTALIIDTNLNTSLSGEPQLRALGLGSQLTGKHATLIVTDDICNTDDRDSEAERNFTKARYREMMNVLSTNKNFNQTRILNIGTPWHEEDVFSLMEKALDKKDDMQLQFEAIPQKDRTLAQKEYIRAANMNRGLFVYDCYQTGLMTEEDIEWKRQVLNDDALFAANYLLTLVSDDEKPFPKINNTGNYSNSFFADCYEVYAQLDSSYGGADSTSLSIGGFDWDNNNTVVYGRLWNISIDENYIEVGDIMFECGVSTVYMETNADKGLMGQKFREMGFNVISYHESMNKHAKIVSTLRPYWREKGNELLPCVQFTKETDPKYLSQIHEYKKGVAHDDAPDSLSRLLIMARFGAMPIRVY